MRLKWCRFLDRRARNCL